MAKFALSHFSLNQALLIFTETSVGFEEGSWAFGIGVSVTVVLFAGVTEVEGLHSDESDAMVPSGQVRMPPTGPARKRV